MNTLTSLSTIKSVLLPVAFIGFSMNAFGAPQIQGIEGAKSHGDSLVITGANFTELPPATRTLWDSVENQPEWDNLPHGTEVPTDRGPWTQNGNSWSKPVIVAKQGDTRHAQSSASYQGRARAYLGWPRAFANNTNRNLYVSWWFKPDSDLNEYGGANKIIRIWDSPSGEYTRLAWTQALLGGYALDDGQQPSYQTWGGEVGQWNRMEIYVDSSRGTIETWANGKIVHSVDDYEKKNTTDGLTVGLIGFDPNYADRYADLNYRMDDIYISSELARVEISNSPTWQGINNNKEIQPFQSWNDNQIEIEVNLGQFNSDEDLYLYVIDKNGDVNDEGFNLCYKCPNSPILELR